MFNHSGMNRVAESMAEAEKRLGLDSHICNIQDSKDWEYMADCDVHVAHTHFPDSMRKRLTKPLKLVWVGHGTPENVFTNAVNESKHSGYGHGDSFMLTQHWLRTADARVTFWPRHQWIYSTMVDRGTKVHCIPLGVDLDFWGAGESRGKYAGSPSLWTGENPHQIKWPLDLIQMWPHVYPELDGASLHCCYLATDLHRTFAPLINGNGAGYAMHWSPITWIHEELRNVFKSVDYFIGLVRYGDFNRLSLEANAAGCRTISYAGNPYSDFWLPEGDQRNTAAELIRVLKGEIEPREKEKVPSFMDTAVAMQTIYEGILCRTSTSCTAKPKLRPSRKSTKTTREGR